MQRRAIKTSKPARELLEKLERSGTREGRWLILLSETRPEPLEEAVGRALYELRKKLLLDLANLHDQGSVRFWRHWGRRFSRAQVADAALLDLRNELRVLWDRQTPLSQKQAIVNGWTKWTPRGFARLLPYQGWFASLGLGRVIPAHRSLHSQLVQAVLEHLEGLTVCHNPGCPVKHFLSRRKDQKYCERGDCTAYAQSQYSLKSWRKRRANTEDKKKWKRR